MDEDITVPRHSPRLSRRMRAGASFSIYFKGETRCCLLVVQYFSGNKTWRCTVGKNNIDGIPRAYYHMTQLEGSEQSKGLLHVPGCIPLKIHYLRRKRQLQGASMRKLLFLSQSTNVLCSDT